MPGSTTANGTAEQGELATVKVEGTAGKEGAAEAALDPGKEDEKAKEKPKQKKKRVCLAVPLGAPILRADPRSWERVGAGVSG